MAKNTDNKRLAVKHVRDKAKHAYDKASECYICGTTEDLELHHTNSISLLLEQWAKKRGYDISTDAGILEVRDEFIAFHDRQLYQDVRTLCNKHHVNLHRVYGKAPPLSTADKQIAWIEKQKAKHEGRDIEPSEAPKKSFFGAFI